MKQNLRRDFNVLNLDVIFKFPVLLSLVSGSFCGQLCKGSRKDSNPERRLEEASSSAGAVDEASQWAPLPKTGRESKRKAQQQQR